MVLKWGSPLGAIVGLFGFCSSTFNSVWRERPFSVNSLFFISCDVFVFQITNFHDTTLVVDSERPCQRNQDCEKTKEGKMVDLVFTPDSHLESVDLVQYLAAECGDEYKKV